MYNDTIQNIWSTTDIYWYVDARVFGYRLHGCLLSYVILKHSLQIWKLKVIWRRVMLPYWSNRRRLIQEFTITNRFRSDEITRELSFSMNCPCPSFCIICIGRWIKITNNWLWTGNCKHKIIETNNINILLKYQRVVLSNEIFDGFPQAW